MDWKNKNHIKIIDSIDTCLVPNDLHYLISITGLGRKMVLVILDALFKDQYGAPNDCHTRRLLVALGFVSTRISDDHMCCAAESCLHQKDFIMVNTVAAGIAQILRSFPKKSFIRPILVQELLTVAEKHCMEDDMRRFLTHYYTPKKEKDVDEEVEQEDETEGDDGDEGEDEDEGDDEDDNGEEEEDNNNT